MEEERNDPIERHQRTCHPFHCIDCVAMPEVYSNSLQQLKFEFGIIGADLIMSPLFRSNQQRRKKFRRNYHGLPLCVAIFSSITITSLCVANENRINDSYIRNNHHRQSTSYTSSILSLRGGNSANQQERSLSSNNKDQNSPFEYIPITALNNYGQSTQLRHAMEAASRYGTPTIACLCCDTENNGEDESINNARNENSIVVCSLQRPRFGIIAPTIPTGSSSTNIRRYSTTSAKVHPSIQGLVKVIATRDDVDDINGDEIPIHNLHTAIVCTGIQSDATFLVSQLQRHFSKFWFRYNTIPTNSMAVVKMIQDVLLDCMGYDWSEEMGSAKVSGGIGSAAPSYNDNDEDGSGSSAAGRPLGLSSFLLSLANNDDVSSSRPTITLIEANGSSEHYVARAMGFGAQKANKLLSQKWKRGISRDEVKKMMQEILREVAIERGWLESDDDKVGSEESSLKLENDNEMHVGLTVVCETLTRSGIDIECSPLR